MIALLARWTEKLPGGPQAGTSNSPPPPLARVMGVVIQQHDSSCLVVHDVRLQSVLDTVVISGDDVWHSSWCV